MMMPTRGTVISGRMVVLASTDRYPTRLAEVDRVSSGGGSLWLSFWHHRRGWMQPRPLSSSAVDDWQPDPADPAIEQATMQGAFDELEAISPWAFGGVLA